MTLKTLWKKARGKFEVRKKPRGRSKIQFSAKVSVQKMEACKIKWEQNGRRFLPVRLFIHPILCGESLNRRFWVQVGEGWKQENME
jgi:hypothetical protein